MPTSLKEISAQLKESALKSAVAHLQEYLKHEDEIITAIETFNGIKSEYYCYDIKESKKISKFLAIYSDFTSFFTAPSNSSEYHIHIFKDNNPRNISRKIDIPPALQQTSLNKGFPILASFLYKNDSETRHIAKEISPLLENGQFLLRPIRSLIVNLPPNLSDAQHEIFFANANTPDNHWVAKAINEKDTYTIYNDSLKANSKVLFELTLPFFDKASFANLAKILEDETDLISGFRATLKDLSQKVINGESIDDLKHYIIRPEIDKLNRKFKSITNIHRLSIGASVAAFTISLISIQVDAQHNFQTLFNTLLGSSAIGFVATEIRYQQEVDKLKDNPYFLLWKISKAVI